MSLGALALVLFGALCHATWNIVAKKSGGGLPFVWLFGMVSVIAAIPVAAWAWLTHPQQFDTLMWAAALGSGLIHVLYSLILQQGYRVADFAVVYPVARGSGPMLTVLLSVLLLGERPSLLGTAAIAAILAGVFISAGGTGLFSGNTSSRRHLGVSWGLLTGLFIAAYTLLDGWAIRSLGMTPILFYAVGLAFRSLLLAPFALRQPARLAEQWRLHRRAILIVGILSPLAYLLVLFALQLAPLSYVAPVREISMLLGTFVGARRLQEALKPSQYVGAIVMLLGVLGLGYA
ncbi:DMT family transporter [Propionivibrio dicarboxylicus]|uniref:EamA-like transporter family protein n=1 Tax=Propionivibrio dicarboxylicus TaxID=83767 RepID=A0A1G8GFI0_9RHOO|nr:DMT family transporter [Propionivibrio dicarboxylicus]SDH93115.1 EamA-like transporter family protein [Propionivibrio dicarboxylicus]